MATKIQIKKLSPHPLADSCQKLDKETFQALKLDIHKHGVITPIQINSKFQILDGVHRYKACNELKIEKIPYIKINKSKKDEINHILKSNLLRKSLDTHHRYLNIARLYKNQPKTDSKSACDFLGSGSIGFKPTTIKKSLLYRRAYSYQPDFKNYSPSKVVELLRENKKIKNFKKRCNKTLSYLRGEVTSKKNSTNQALNLQIQTIERSIIKATNSIIKMNKKSFNQRMISSELLTNIDKLFFELTRLQKKISSSNKTKDNK